jgi:dienelactone hydrolase
MAIALVLLAVPATAGAQEPGEYVVDPASLPFDALPLTITERWWGVDDNPGASGDGWRIEVPLNWNGGLLLWAHGYRGEEPELTVDDPPLRAYLVATGWAWAASSYRANGYAVEEGVEDTHELLAIFAEQTGRTPERVIFHGASMGGHVTAAAIERYPDAYDGALPICGAMGDVALYDYFQDVNLVAQALAGVDAGVPPGPGYLTETVPAIRASLGYPGDLNGRGYQFRAAVEQLSGGERPGFEASFDYWGRTDGEPSETGQPFLFEVYGGALTGGRTDPRAEAATGNAGRVYSYDTDPAQSPEEAELNAAVTRDEATGPPPFPVITGRLPVPVLSLHTTGDLFVPFSMEQVYAAEAAANGAAGLLVQRAIRDVRHCGFNADEIVIAFDDLVHWIDTGERPEGDDVRDPAAVADRDFGCAFTSPLPVAERSSFRPCSAWPAVDLTGGRDAVATAVEVSRASYETADAVVLASDDAHPDALAAAPLAARRDGPLLLTPADGLRADVAAEITRLGAGTAYLVGSAAVLSPAVEQALADLGLETVRLEGAGAVARELGGTDAFVVGGDGLAVAGLAAFLEEPILPVEGDAVPPATLEAIAGLGITSVTATGCPIGSWPSWRGWG